MTRDDIIRMAREAGFKVGDNLSGITLVGVPNQIGLSHLTVDELAIFAALVAAEKDKEIERLRKVLKKLEYFSDGTIRRYPTESEVEAARREQPR